MKNGRAALLLHRRGCHAHLDLILEGGGRCPTVHLRRDGSWGWGVPHRRRYLSWTGVLGGGRGRILALLTGRASWHGRGASWTIRLRGAARGPDPGRLCRLLGFGRLLPVAWADGGTLLVRLAATGWQGHGSTTAQDSSG